MQLKTKSAIKEYQERTRLPRRLLHNTIAGKTWSLFVRGDYDTAVFQAFKEVEVAVRNAAGFDEGMFGKELMRKAFRPTTEPSPGPLSDSNELSEEQKSLQELFAGAYGRARNPTAHRHGVLNDATEAFELLVIASHLLRIVECRCTTNVVGE